MTRLTCLHQQHCSNSLRIGAETHTRGRAENVVTTTRLKTSKELPGWPGSGHMDPREYTTCFDQTNALVQTGSIILMLSAIVKPNKLLWLSMGVIARPRPATSRAWLQK